MLIQMTICNTEHVQQGRSTKLQSSQGASYRLSDPVITLSNSNHSHPPDMATLCKHCIQKQ